MNQQWKRSADQAMPPQGQLLTRLIISQTLALIFLAVMVAGGGLLLAETQLLMLLPAAGVAALIGVISYWLVRSGRFYAASYLFLLGTTLTVTAIVSIRGYRDASALYYLWPILGAVSILEARGSSLVISLSAALYGLLVLAEGAGYHIPPLPYDPGTESLMTVGSRILMFFLLSYLVRLSVRDLDQAYQATRNAAQRWRVLNETLEERVRARTGDLERRSTQLEATTRIARDAASVLDPQELLQRAVSMISDQFGFYHTGIYLLNPGENWAVLQAASSEGGQRMLEYGYRLRVGEWSPVGQAIAQAESRVIRDTSTDAAYTPPLDLPETRSEVVLPLKARGTIIGALDVHSTDTNAFPADTVYILQTMADQIAVAISNSRLFHRLQESLNALQRTHGETSLQEWARLARDTAIGYRYDRTGTTLVSGDPADEPEAEANLPELSVPIKHRDYTIGTIRARKHGEEGKWTGQEVDLFEALADQLSTTLESTRLYQETQRRATRERLTREITSDIRAARDIDEAVERTVSALSRALDASKMVVRIGTREVLLPTEEGEAHGG